MVAQLFEIAIIQVEAPEAFHFTLPTLCEGLVDLLHARDAFNQKSLELRLYLLDLGRRPQSIQGYKAVCGKTGAQLF